MVDDPLYDAVGHAITPASVRAASAEREGRARIGRDRDGGVEGASHEFTREAVFELIRKKEAEGCVFTYPGADQDAYAVGGSIGVHAAATQDFAGDGAGTRAVFSSVSAAVLDPRTGTWCLVRLGQEEPGGRENVLRDVVLCTLLFVSAGGASDADAQVRLAAFRFLDDLQLTYEQGVPRRALERGFDFAGTRVPLVGPRGIFKPAILSELPLSITTKPIVACTSSVYRLYTVSDPSGQVPPVPARQRPKRGTRMLRLGSDQLAADAAGLRHFELGIQARPPAAVEPGDVRLGLLRVAEPAAVEEDGDKAAVRVLQVSHVAHRLPPKPHRPRREGHAARAEAPSRVGSGTDTGPTRPVGREFERENVDSLCRPMGRGIRRPTYPSFSASPLSSSRSLDWVSTAQPRRCGARDSSSPGPSPAPHRS